mmetsp:Transcript_19333/g.55731  ORF Transcript_19333/g.55731 Transcript_19333/m.55731 type:complete len:342 (+) Transcript_19333:180-1205(+)
MPNHPRARATLRATGDLYRRFSLVVEPTLCSLVVLSGHVLRQVVPRGQPAVSTLSRHAHRCASGAGRHTGSVAARRCGALTAARDLKQGAVQLAFGVEALPPRASFRIVVECNRAAHHVGRQAHGQRVPMVGETVRSEDHEAAVAGQDALLALVHAAVPQLKVATVLFLPSRGEVDEHVDAAVHHGLKMARIEVGVHVEVAAVRRDVHAAALVGGVWEEAAHAAEVLEEAHESRRAQLAEERASGRPERFRRELFLLVLGTLLEVALRSPVRAAALALVGQLGGHRVNNVHREQLVDHRMLVRPRYVEAAPVLPHGVVQAGCQVHGTSSGGAAAVGRAPGG